MIRQRLLAGTFSNCMGKLMSVGTWFVLTPFVLHRLGAQGYALWVLTGAITSYGFLLDFGLGGAVVKYVAQHSARREFDEARQVIASAVWVYAAVAVAVIGLGAALAPMAPAMFGVAADQRTTAVWLMFLTLVNVGVAVAFEPWSAALRGLQRYDLSNAVAIANTLVEALAIVVALSLGWGLIGMVAVLIPVNIVTGIACAVVVFRVAPALRIRWRDGSLRTMRRMATFGTSTFTISLASRLHTKTDEFVIAAFRMLDLVTPYALARRLGELSHMICVQFVKVVMPIASSLDASQDSGRLRTLYIVSSRVALGVAVPITAVLVILGHRLLTLWVGSEYAHHQHLLSILAVATLITVSQWPAIEILQGIARHRVVAITSLAAGLTNVGLSALLLPTFGLAGVAAATLIAAIGAWLGVILPYALRSLQVSYGTALREIWAPALGPGAAAAAVLLVLEWRMSDVTFAGTLGAIFAAAIVYVAGYLAMQAAAAERALIADTVGVAFRRLRPRPGITKA
jgi:O-antigen/teichoic acid export membrane protein